MIENKAIERIKYRMHTVEQVVGKSGMEDLEVAIKALEDVQQYRAIGTPEECRAMKKDFAEALSDWRQYRKVGTLEECRAAVEKQTAKRPRIMGNAMICPSCPRCFKNASPTYCPSCGQWIDWGE